MDRPDETDVTFRRIVALLLDTVVAAAVFAALYIPGSDVLSTRRDACEPFPAPNCNVIELQEAVDEDGSNQILMTMADGRVLDFDHPTFDLLRSTYIADAPSTGTLLGTLAVVVLLFVVAPGLSGATAGMSVTRLRLATTSGSPVGMGRSFLRWALPDGIVGTIAIAIAAATSEWTSAWFAVAGLLIVMLRPVRTLLSRLGRGGPLSDDGLGVAVIEKDRYHPDDTPAEPAEPSAPAESGTETPAATAPRTGRPTAEPPVATTSEPATTTEPVAPAGTTPGSRSYDPAPAPTDPTHTEVPSTRITPPLFPTGTPTFPPPGSSPPATDAAATETPAPEPTATEPTATEPTVAEADASELTVISLPAAEEPEAGRESTLSSGGSAPATSESSSVEAAAPAARAEEGAVSTALTTTASPYQPIWDDARLAYICWEPYSGQWLQWDDQGSTWGPISR